MGVCAVVVLGDIGRSPRMQYHSISLKEHSLTVHIVAYAQTNPRPELIDPNIILHPLPVCPPASKSTNFISFLGLALWKIILTTLSLWWILLFRVPSLSHVIVQAPLFSNSIVLGFQLVPHRIHHPYPHWSLCGLFASCGEQSLLWIGTITAILFSPSLVPIRSL